MLKVNYLEKVASSLGARYYTLKSALGVFRQLYGRNITQIGCSPISSMHEDAYLTKIICNLIQDKEKIQYHIFDEGIIYDGVNLSTDLARFVSKEPLRNDTRDRFFIRDPRELGNYKQKIDLLILNEINYPHKELINESGIEGSFLQVRDKLNSMSKEEFNKKYNSIVESCQNRQLEQYINIRKNLHRNSIVLLEGNDFPGGGQTCLAKEQLAKDGFICFLNSKQSVWVKR